MENVELAPQAEAQRIIDAAKTAAQERAAFVAGLKQRRVEITETLVLLGEEKRGIGRPVGKRTRKPKGQEAAA
jgi:hypothetical protein